MIIDGFYGMWGALVVKQKKATAPEMPLPHDNTDSRTILPCINTAVVFVNDQPETSILDRVQGAQIMH